jgi:hypothetical protein
MRGIYNFILETNHILQLQFKVHVMIFPTLNILYSSKYVRSAQCG